MNLMNLGSDGDITQAVEGKEIIPSGRYVFEELGPTKAAVKREEIEAGRERIKLAKTELAFQAPRAIRGWMDIIKTIAIIFVGLFFLVGGFASVGAILDFMKENLWFDVLAILFIIIWIRKRG